VFVSWHDHFTGKIYFDRDVDGFGTGLPFGTDVTVFALIKSTHRAVLEDAKIPAQPDRGIYTAPTLAIDRTGGTYNGRLYLSFVDRVAGAASCSVGSAMTP
jgi:hypothetical protein